MFRLALLAGAVGVFAACASNSADHLGANDAGVGGGDAGGAGDGDLSGLMVEKGGYLLGDAATTSDSGGPVPPRHDGGPSTLLNGQQACQMVAERQCQAYGRCAPFLARALFGADKSCIERLKLVCLLDLDAPDSGQSVPGLVRCAQQTENATCNDLIERRGLDACSPMGRRPNGGGCSRNTQCESAYCRPTTGCGVCAARAPVGAPCDNDDHCHPGHICSAAKTCVVPRDLGAKCDGRSNPCHATLSCTNGVCTAPAPLGSRCDSDDQCAALQGELCQERAGVASLCATVRIALPNQPCGIVSGVPTACVGELADGEWNLCRPDPSGTLRCVAPARDGERCGEAADNLPCEFPAFCFEGVCRLPSPKACE